MLTKKIIVLWMVFCLLLTGCAASQKGNGENEIPSDIAASKAMVSSDTDSTEQPEETHTNQPFGRFASAQIEMKECRQTTAFPIK